MAPPPLAWLSILVMMMAPTLTLFLKACRWREGEIKADARDANQGLVVGGLPDRRVHHEHDVVRLLRADASTAP